MIRLYDDQQDLVDRTRAAFRRNRSVLMQAATGAGKTVMAAYIVGSAAGRARGQTWFMVPRRELVNQTAETFRQFGIEFGFIAAGKPVNPYAPVQLVMEQTAASRIKSGRAGDPPALLIVDEAHVGGAAQDRIIEWARGAGAYVLGLSATPWRMSGEGMGRIYQRMVEGPPVADLIEAGRLSRYRLFAPSKPDLGGVKSRRGDYVESQLATLMETDGAIIGDATRYYRQIAPGKLCVAYCASIRHSKMVRDAFRDVGVPADHIDGTMDDSERRSIIERFAARETTVLCNCAILTFGFDLSAAVGRDVPIEGMIDLRPTKSLALQCQKWGRALRRKPDPAIILDHAGNAAVHGLPDQHREWTLDGQKKRKREEPEMPIRQCPRCFAVMPAAARHCPECGHVFEFKGREIQQSDGELTEVDADAIRATRRREEGQCRSLDDFIKLGKERGYKPGWAHHRWAARSRVRQHA